MDLNILMWIHENLHSNNVINQIWKHITMTCDVACIWVVLCCVLFNFKKTRKISIIMALSMGVNCLIVEVGLKNIFMRTRPFTLEPEFANFLNTIGYEPPMSSSFPSGHASTSIAVAMTLFLYNKKWGTPSVILAVLIALSRAFLCVHFPTDILYGLIIGILVAHIVYFYANKIMNKIEEKFTGEKKIYPMLYSKTERDIKNNFWW